MGKRVTGAEVVGVGDTVASVAGSFIPGNVIVGANVVVDGVGGSELAGGAFDGTKVTNVGFSEIGASDSDMSVVGEMVSGVPGAGSFESTIVGAELTLGVMGCAVPVEGDRVGRLAGYTVGVPGDGMDGI